MNIVITGVNGFVGKHLVRELINHGHTVVGIGREEHPHEEISELLGFYYAADLSQLWPKTHEQIDAVIHLAGLAAVGPSFSQPQSYINLNSAMVTHLCEAYVKDEVRPRVLIISSGAVYDSSGPMPMSESSSVTFGSPYAVSKVLVENQAAYYRSRGLECVVARPFNHIGPGQLSGFLLPDLYKKLIDRTNEDESILVGNLTTKRDYTDVRDVVRAYRMLATETKIPEHLVYNICSGVSHSGTDILDCITRAMDIPTVQTKIDQSLVRPNDIMDIRGDNTRLIVEYGWSPEYSLDQTVSDFVASSRR